jgi:hypothetical protein
MFIFKNHFIHVTMFVKKTNLTFNNDLKKVSYFSKIKNKKDVKFHLVRKKEAINLKKPIKHGKINANFNAKLEKNFPDLGLIEIKNGIISGPNGWIFDNYGFFYPETTWYGRKHREIKTIISNHSLEKKNGTCLSLASDWSNVNYGHFLLDSLSRFDLFSFSNFNLSKIDWFYLPLNFKIAKKFIEKLGIPFQKIIIPENQKSIQFEHLIGVSFPGIRRIYPNWTVEFLKNFFLTPKFKTFKKIYIPRNTTRKIKNEHALTEIACKYGFEIFEPEKNENPQFRFAQSNFVISAHGSALADILFCEEGTKILELIPSDHIYPYWYTLSEAASLEYHYIVGKSIGNHKTTYGPSPYDFFIEPTLFKNALLSNL